MKTLYKVWVECPVGLNVTNNIGVYTTKENLKKCLIERKVEVHCELPIEELLNNEHPDFVYIEEIKG